MYVAGRRRSSPGLMLGLFCCRVMIEHAVDVDRYCSKVISLLLFSCCYADAHSRACMYGSNEDPRGRSGDLHHQASGNALLVLKLFERLSHTLAGNTPTKAWIQNALSLHFLLQMEALAPNNRNDRRCVSVADCFCSCRQPPSRIILGGTTVGHKLAHL